MIVDGCRLTVHGRFPRIARLSAEYYEYCADPQRFVARAREAHVRADVLTMLQMSKHQEPLWPLPFEREEISVLSVTTYDDWFKKQLNDKTRNMVRKADKKGVVLKVCPFSDELVAGIKEIYDEAPIRQGKPFAHYGKDLDTLRRDHVTYEERSDFICAYFGDELIGFLKLVHGDGVSNIMQIVSKVAHRDKAPTNGLIAKAVAICAERGVPRLHYGLWSRGGLGEFKKHHGFDRYAVVRYFVSLTLMGRLAMKLGMHRKLVDRLPPPVVERLVEWRGRWHSMRLATR